MLLNMQDFKVMVLILSYVRHRHFMCICAIQLTLITKLWSYLQWP